MAKKRNAVLVIEPKLLAKQNEFGENCLTNKTLPALQSKVSKLLKSNLDNNFEKVIISVPDFKKLSVGTVQKISSKACYRLQLFNLPIRIKDQRTGLYSDDNIIEYYSKMANKIIIGERHLYFKNKPIMDGFEKTSIKVVSGVNYKMFRDAVKMHLVETFFYNHNYHNQYSYLKVRNYRSTDGEQWEDISGELNINYDYKCIDRSSRNNKKFTATIFVDYDCTDDDIKVILEKIKDTLVYYKNNNKINFRVRFKNSDKKYIIKYKGEPVRNKLDSLPKFVTDNALIYNFFGINYKNFGDMKMPDIEYFLDKEYLAMPEMLSVPKLEDIKEIFHHKGIYIFDNIIDREIAIKTKTVHLLSDEEQKEFFEQNNYDYEEDLY